MIVSNKHKIIIFRPRKVAGTSIEDLLLKYLEGNAYPDVYAHLTYKQVRELVGNNIFNSYKKVILVRNPYDIVISWFWYGHRNNNSFKLLKKKEDIINAFHKWFNRLNNFNKGFFEGECKYDYIIKYENMESDCVKLLRGLNIKVTNNKLQWL